MDDVDIEAEFLKGLFPVDASFSTSQRKLNPTDKNLLEGHLPLRVNVLDSLTLDASLNTPQRRLSPTDKNLLEGNL